MANKPKILFWDIETSYNLLAGFGLRDQNFSHKQIVQEWYIICASWMFEGDKKVSSIASVDGNDYRVITKLYEVIEKADILIHHNGDKFDLKKLRARAIYHDSQLRRSFESRLMDTMGIDERPFPIMGNGPLIPIKTIDTLKVSRSLFGFTSHRLDYIATHLGLKSKHNTTDGLWLRILKGDKEAMKEMVEYNKQDVIVLRNVFKELQPHIKNHPSLALLKGNEDRGHCRNCGGTHLNKQGYDIRQSRKYPRYKCQDCGAWKTSTSVFGESTE